MKNSRLLNLLYLFDEKELKQLQHFAKLNTAPKRKGVLPLFAFLTKEPSQNLKILTKQEVFQQILPKEKYQDLKMRHIMSNACDLIEQSLLYQSIVKNSDYQQVVLLEAFRSRNAQKQFEFTEKKIHKSSLSKKGRQKTDDLYYDFLFAMELQRYYSTKKRSDISYINKVHEDLDMFYFIQKLQTACTALNLEKLYNQKAALHFIKPIVAHVEKHQLYKKNALLALYYYAFTLLKNPTDKVFHQLVAHVKSNIEVIAIDEVQVAFILALNYCIKSINAGKNKFNTEIFDLYAFGIEWGILLDGKYLSNITFSNVVTIGLRLKRFEETIAFIEDKKSLLNKNLREDHYVFNLSKYYFETGSYDKVTALYSEYKMKEVLLDIQSRIIQVKAFYELKEYALCHSLNNNLKQLISRKGVLAYHKENYSNVVYCFKRMLNVNPYHKIGIQKLITQFEKKNPLTEKQWCLKKLKSML